MIEATPLGRFLDSRTKKRKSGCNRNIELSTTKIRANVLQFMVEFFNDNDSLPTTEQVAKNFGWNSNNSAYQHIKALERDGYLKRNNVNGLMFNREMKTKCFSKLTVK
ncbi:hypothetical protein A134_23225 [Vibrio crassostreae 9CS106]|uniref:LexA repressor DNA-binding domain-containing protein n=1 Tax=Vibrio crassostreae 9CS106 TaxID=1191300 RepID=A0A1B1C3M5_9VIBR|nr:hypothetical protein A134_23225 [Vibrio crassostreae 9CS106]